MSISESSFKVYVGTFPERNVSFSGNAITVYQIGSFKYESTKILNNLDVINDYYGENPSETCTTSLFGCTERLTVPIPPNVCPPGGGGGGGQPGRDGAPGADGADGLSTIIQLALNTTITPTCTDPPQVTGSITPPTPINDTQQSQTLTLNFALPPSCPGGGGGGGDGPTVSAIGDDQTNTLAESNRINVSSGINTDLGSGITNPTKTIDIQIHCKAIGYIKLNAYTWDASINRWLYNGYPHLFMIGENQKIFTDSLAPTHPKYNELLSDLVNVAEGAYSVCIPLHADFAEVTPPGGTTAETSGLIMGRHPSLPQSYPYPDPKPIVKLYQLDGQYFLNETYTYTVKKQARITKATYLTQYNKPFWKYEVQFGETSYNIQDPLLKPAEFFNNLAPRDRWQTRYGFRTTVIAYNMYEVGNTASSGYGYALDPSGYVPPPSGQLHGGGFRLQTSPSFLFSHVPINTIVDVEVDNNGGFYFKQPNAIIGVC